MPGVFTMNWRSFPPWTREIQFDEKWAFVLKKKSDDDLLGVADRRCGPNWDHVAFDPEHRLVLEVHCGKRTGRLVRQLVQATRDRTGHRLMRLITTDEYKPYRHEILDAYGKELPRKRPYRPGQPRKVVKRASEGLLYATLHKTRKKGRVVKIEPRLQFGTQARLDAALKASSVSRRVNTSFIERYNGTDRHRNSRKVRKSYRFSKDWEIHQAATYFSMYAYNFCWPVRTLRQPTGPGRYRARTPAMAARLTDHVWSLQEWLTYPAKPG